MNLLPVTPGTVIEAIPAALTEIGNERHREKHDLSQLLSVYHGTVVTGTNNAAIQVSKDAWNLLHSAKAVSARVYANVYVPGSAGSALRAQYSTDGSSWAYLDGAAGPTVSLSSAGLAVGAWVTIAAPALADVFLRLITINGDGSTSVVLGLSGLQVK